MKQISILVIVDNRILREGIETMLEEQPDLKVAAALGNCANGMKLIRELQPSIVLLNLELRNLDCLKFVETIRRFFNQVKVIVIDLVPIQCDLLEYVKAGVSGFILKDATVNDFLTTIRSVAEGKKVLPSNLTESLFTQLVDKAAKISGPSRTLGEVKMTKREKQVVDLIADGLTNKEIAQTLHLSTNTVKCHIHNILEKLALRTRLQIANYAYNSPDHKI